MQSAKFVVVSHPSVRKSNGKGYSWGLLLFEKTPKGAWESDLIYISEPVERTSIQSLQNISGAFLDSFKITNHRIATQQDRDLMARLERWSVSVNIPDCLFNINKGVELNPYIIEDIFLYIRSEMSGRDSDETVYTVPDYIGEMDLHDGMVEV